MRGPCRRLGAAPSAWQHPQRSGPCERTSPARTCNSLSILSSEGCRVSIHLLRLAMHAHCQEGYVQRAPQDEAVMYEPWAAVWPTLLSGCRTTMGVHLFSWLSIIMSSLSCCAAVPSEALCCSGRTSLQIRRKCKHTSTMLITMVRQAKATKMIVGVRMACKERSQGEKQCRGLCETKTGRKKGLQHLRQRKEGHVSITTLTSSW